MGNYDVLSEFGWTKAIPLTLSFQVFYNDEEIRTRSNPSEGQRKGSEVIAYASSAAWADRIVTALKLAAQIRDFKDPDIHG